MDKLRGEFEAWLRSTSGGGAYSIDRDDDGDYVDTRTFYLHCGYEAAKAQSEWVSKRLDDSKSWVDQNVHDGEDRAGAKGDMASFNPDDLQELFDDFIAYVKGPSE